MVSEQGLKPTNECEIVSSRVLNFPRELVFQAFADPKHLANWWGPKGFMNLFEKFDFKPGGEWRFVMRGPNGKDFPNHSVFQEISKPNRIVFKHLGTIHPFQMIMTLDELPGNQTKFQFRMIHETAEECSKVKAFAPQANEQNFDRLESELSKMISS